MSLLIDPNRDYAQERMAHKRQLFRVVTALTRMSLPTADLLQLTVKHLAQVMTDSLGVEVKLTVSIPSEALQAAMAQTDVVGSD